jgi:hypothetical protein
MFSGKRLSSSSEPRRSLETRRQLLRTTILKVRERGDLAGAERLADRALTIDLDNLGPNHPSVAVDHVTLSEALRKQGRNSEAKTHFKFAIVIYEKVFGSQDPRTKELKAAATSLFGK